MLGRTDPDTLLDRFPGPLTISVSIRKYLFALAMGGLFMALGIWFVSRPDAIAVTLKTSHGAVRGEGWLYLLILLRLARDMPQAIAEVGWFALISFGLADLFITGKLFLGVTGFWGLTLDGEGFTIIALKQNKRHLWVDVGDFESQERYRLGRRPMRFSKNFLVFNDYRAPKSPIKWLQRSGRNRALVENYEYSPEELAVFMSAWRERALEGRTKNKS
jgi:hypothetical protein